MAAEIQVEEGPDQGSRVPLAGRVLVGRAEECQLRLHDGSVSRRHCALELRGNELLVEDLGGRGGTLVLGRELRREAVAAPLEAWIELGDTRLRVHALASALVVEGFRVGERLGAGGSGEVYAAQDASGRPVALKQLAADADEVSRARFLREARLAEQLTHPALGRILGLTQSAAGRPVLVRELVEGQSLAERLEQGPLAWREGLSLGVRLAEGLAQAHEAGVIHRDVKPANVIASPAGAKLIDFDLALVRRSGALRATLTRLTRSGQGLGTLAYLAPEQLRDAHRVGPAADVYGLGVTLLHALSGAPPFAEVPPEGFLEALLERGPGPLAGRVAGLPLTAAVAVERAYALDPAQRYPDMKSCAAAWRALLG